MQHILDFRNPCHLYVESKDIECRTLLSWTSSEGHEAVVKLLLDKNADIESKDKYDRTPLSQAAEVFICRIVRMPQAKDVSDF